MFPTVSYADLKENRSEDKEKTQFANAVKRAVNMVSRVRVTLATAATGTYTAAWTSEDMPEGSAWAIDAHVVARATSGPAGRNRYDQGALFYRQSGGAATQQGATVALSPTIASIAGANVQFAIVGNAIAFRVADDGASHMDWDAFIEGREVT